MKSSYIFQVKLHPSGLPKRDVFLHLHLCVLGQMLRSEINIYPVNNLLRVLPKSLFSNNVALIYNALFYLQVDSATFF